MVENRGGNWKVPGELLQEKRHCFPRGFAMSFAVFSVYAGVGRKYVSDLRSFYPMRPQSKRSFEVSGRILTYVDSVTKS